MLTETNFIRLAFCTRSLRVVTRFIIVFLFLSTFIVACGAKTKIDPWLEYKAKELARIEEFGEPKSFYAVYEGTFGPAQIRMATWMVGNDLFRVDSDIGIVSVAMGSDGTNAWMQTKGAKPRKLSKSEEEELYTSKYFDSVEYLTDNTLKYEIGGTQNWENGKVVEVRLTSIDGYRRDLFIQSNTYELAGYRSYGTSTVLVKIHDLEWYGAMSVPKKVAMQIENLNLSLEFKLVTAEIDVEVDPTLFMPPAGELKPLITSTVSPVFMDFISSPSGLIFIKGSVGEHSGTFLFDTGASSSILDESIIESLNVVEESGFAAVGVSGAEGARIVKITEHVSIGDSKQIELPNEIGYIVMDLTSISKGIGNTILGIIGNDLPSRGKVAIDFPKKRIRVTPYTKEALGRSEENPLASLFGATEKPKLAANEFELIFIGDLVAIKSMLNDSHDASFILDTGFSGEVGLLPTAVESFNLKLSAPKALDIVYGIGGVTKLKGWISMLKVQALGFESEITNIPVISGPIASVVGGSADGLIGSRFLLNLHFELDYNGGVLRILSTV